MSEQLALKRAMARGAQVEPEVKQVDVQGIGDIVQEIRRMAEAQQRSQQLLIESLGAIVAAIEDKQVESVQDLKPLVDAVKSLSVTKSNIMYDYHLSGERNEQTQLIKLDTVKFTAIPKEVH